MTWLAHPGEESKQRTDMQETIGIWLIGAWGGVSTSVAVGLAALQAGLTDQTGLVTTLPPFDSLGLADWSRFVIGGHEIRETNYLEEAGRLHEQSGVFRPKVLEGTAERLRRFDRQVRPGTLTNAGPGIEALASRQVKALADQSPIAAVQRLRHDIEQFRESLELDHVIVVNLASTEPRQTGHVPSDWTELWHLLESSDRSPLPASSLYAIAAMQAGCSYINFTPSLGADLPALKELAERQGVLHAGRDGKTGETLLKSVLAPMFAARNLRVLSWVGHNIFGNLDGRVLSDPAHKASKIESKDRLLGQILGYKPQTLVTIEYIESLGDWKTAWDHIHFQGFLDTRMTMQFIWQGCDSLLAAPLVLDLVRLTERERRRSRRGVMRHLACFFKSPMETDTADFASQFRMLEHWAADVAAAETARGDGAGD